MTRPTISLVAVGDVHLDRPEPLSAFGHYGAQIGAANIAFCNVEGPCSDLGAPQVGKPIPVGMQPAVGFNLVSFANNHALDHGYDAFLDTLERLAASGIASAGGGRPWPRQGVRRSWSEMACDWAAWPTRRRFPGALLPPRTARASPLSGCRRSTSRRALAGTSYRSSRACRRR
jgi:hypothetical protein